MKEYCACKTCRHFRDDGKWFINLPKDICHICKRKDAHLVSWVPEVLKDFLGVAQICWSCRNAINAYMNHWSLCWANDSDDAIRWALCDYVRTHYFGLHFYCHRYMERECCKHGHGLGKRVA